jgi:hypothetical protein
MPTVLRIGPYRFFFYAGDRAEPRHVHVERDDAVAKFWLEPVRLQRSAGFSRIELHRIHGLVLANRDTILRCWNAYFAS